MIEYVVGYLFIALGWAIGYGTYHLPPVSEAILAGLFWPLDFIRWIFWHGLRAWLERWKR